MKASELIEELQRLIATHGDKDMYVADDGEYPEYAVRRVEFAAAQISSWYGKRSWQVPDRFEVS